jgi:hypothetical protein
LRAGEFFHAYYRQVPLIEVVYSDHENHLILVVDKPEEGRAVSRAWEEEWRSGIEKLP